MVAAGSDRLILRVEAPSGEVREVPLGAEPIVFGRDPSVEVYVDDQRVSRRHASFRLVNGEPWVDDLGSANGVRLNDAVVERSARFGPADRVRVAGFVLTVQPAEGGGIRAQDEPPVAGAPVAGAPIAGWGATPRSGRAVDSGLPPEEQPRLVGRSELVQDTVFSLAPGENVIGRIEECDIFIHDASVSRRHARITSTKGQLTLLDLESVNGVFVNNRRVGTARLAHGDEIRVGSVRLEVHLPPVRAGRIDRRLKEKLRDVRHRVRVNASWVRNARDHVRSGRSWLRGAFERFRANRSWRVRGSVGLGLAALFVVGTMFFRRPPGELETAPHPRTGTGGSPGASTPGFRAVPGTLASGEASLQVLVRTATSPFSRRGPDGMPRGLPPVDPNFDFDGFVAQALVRVRACDDAGDFACLREETEKLLTRDPLNVSAKALRRKAQAVEVAEQVLARAKRLELRGDYGAAYRLLAAVSSDVPQAGVARQRKNRIRKRAIDDHLERAAEESRRPGTYQKAHERYRSVLRMDGGSEEALRGLRKLERRMRRSKMRFVAYRPPHVKQTGPRTLDEVEEVLRGFYGNHTALARVAEAYARGALDRAKRNARMLAGRGKAAERRRAAKLLRWIQDLEARYERTRKELSNDPERAWSMLVALRKVERKILPETVPTFLTRELEVGLSEAFAERGTSMYDRGRFEEAFRAWESGFKLDPTHPDILTGLRKLETQATQLMQEAELAAQRGRPGVCRRYKRITRMTRGTSEIHRGARRRAFEICG